MRTAKSWQLQADANLIFAGAGCVLLAMAALLVFLTYQVSQWPHVPALVKRSAVVSPIENSYRAEIVVRYEIAGQAYERSLDTHVSGKLRGLVEGIVAPYPEGEEVDLPVNPSDPSDVRMAVTWNWVDLLAPGLVAVTGLIMLAVPSGMAWLDRRATAASVGVAFMVVGLALIGTAGLLAWGKAAVLNWPSTEATVAESSLLTLRSKKQRLRLILDYQVEGRPYRSQCFSRLAQVNPEAMERRQKSLPPGAKLTVRTMPGCPTVVNFEAAPTPAFFFECWILGGIGLLITALGWAIRRSLK